MQAVANVDAVFTRTILCAVLRLSICRKWIPSPAVCPPDLRVIPGMGVVCFAHIVARTEWQAMSVVIFKCHHISPLGCQGACEQYTPGEEVRGTLVAESAAR